MSNQVTLVDAERALKVLGFVESTGRKTSHRQFTRIGGLKVTLPGKGPTSLSKKHVGILRRTLGLHGLSFFGALGVVRGDHFKSSLLGEENSNG